MFDICSRSTRSQVTICVLKFTVQLGDTCRGQFMQIIWWSITFCSAFEWKKMWFLYLSARVIKQRHVVRLSLRAPFGLCFSFILFFFFSYFYDRCNKLLRIISVPVSVWASVRQFYALIRVVKRANLIDSPARNAWEHLVAAENACKARAKRVECKRVKWAQCVLILWHIWGQ